MHQELPLELAFLRDGTDPAVREQGWAAFLQRYNRLLLRAARTFGGDYDDRMDRYRFLVEALHRDDFKRLRAYQTIEASSLTAWLVVVARRLCLDFERQRYGRARSDDGAGTRQDLRRLRRELVRLKPGDVDPDEVGEASMSSAEQALRATQLKAALAAALERLEPRKRLVLKLRFEDDLSVREMSDLLGVRNVFQMYRLIDAALAEARRLLESAGVRDPEP